MGSVPAQFSQVDHRIDVIQSVLDRDSICGADEEADHRDPMTPPLAAILRMAASLLQRALVFINARQFA